MSVTPFRAALDAVAPAARDAWVDRYLGFGDIPADDASLPRGCVPYLPAPVGKLIEVADHARVEPSDVFVDIGSGIGRATVLMSLMTGASAIGIEIQPQLAHAAREIAARAGADRVSVVEGDAATALDATNPGTVFFLYCPFSDSRLAKVLATLELVAKTRRIRVCCLDLPVPECAWLGLVSQPSSGLAIYNSR